MLIEAGRIPQHEDGETLDDSPEVLPRMPVLQVDRGRSWGPSIHTRDIREVPMWGLHQMAEEVRDQTIHNR